MADVELVIRIPKEKYNLIKNKMYCGTCDSDLYKALATGTPLPKGHKRLIEDNFDVGPVFDEEGCRTGYKYVTQYELNNAPTIIEADTESER